MQQISESEKELAAVVLMASLFVVFGKAIYENTLKERLTLYNILHPVKSITAKERIFLLKFIKPFYDLAPPQRKEFLLRFAWFKSKKHFVFYGDITNKEEIKAYVAASAVLLTLGLRDYRFEKSIKRIIVYPSGYYSKISKNHHIGEYNPKLKTLVFSAESLKDGFGIPNDNINLGIHEIAHALMIETLRKNNFEAKRFQVGLAKLKALFDDESFKLVLSKTNYFRDYGKTNFIEFFAVATENFVETPHEFKRSFPDLFKILRAMTNLDLTDNCWQLKKSL